MRDFNDLLNLIKKAAIDAVKASKPTNVVYGTVTSSSPLKINVEQKLNLTDAQLVLTKNVTDYTTNITIDGFKKQITIHNSLKVGDEVVMIQNQGGQEYIIIDRK
nr:DUF2577 domain-containing protein [uncultured Anaerocolumna sp.]